MTLWKFTEVVLRYRFSLIPSHLTIKLASLSSSRTLLILVKGEAFAGFWGGHASAGVNNSAIAAGVAKSVNFLNAQGVGHDLVMDKIRVEPYADAASLVWVTWRIRPRNGWDSWTWETLYGYRMHAEDGVTRAETKPNLTNALAAYLRSGAKIQGKPEGWWEFTVTDDEVKTFISRIPNYLDSYQ